MINPDKYTNGIFKDIEIEEELYKYSNLFVLNRFHELLWSKDYKHTANFPFSILQWEKMLILLIKKDKKLLESFMT